MAATITESRGSPKRRRSACGVKARLGFVLGPVRLQVRNDAVEFIVRKLGVAIDAEEVCRPCRLRRLRFPFREKEFDQALHAFKTLGGPPKFHVSRMI